jgi:hypothetical protein
MQKDFTQRREGEPLDSRKNYCRRPIHSGPFEGLEIPHLAALFEIKSHAELALACSIIRVSGLAFDLHVSQRDIYANDIDGLEKLAGDREHPEKEKDYIAQAAAFVFFADGADS